MNCGSAETTRASASASPTKAPPSPRSDPLTTASPADVGSASSQHWQRRGGTSPPRTVSTSGVSSTRHPPAETPEFQQPRSPAGHVDVVVVNLVARWRPAPPTETSDERWLGMIDALVHPIASCGCEPWDAWSTGVIGHTHSVAVTFNAPRRCLRFTTQVPFCLRTRTFDKPKFPHQKGTSADTPPSPPTPNRTGWASGPTPRTPTTTARSTTQAWSRSVCRLAPRWSSATRRRPASTSATSTGTRLSRCWKTAVVLQQLYTRYVRGESTDERMATRGEKVGAQARRAMAILDRAS